MVKYMSQKAVVKAHSTRTKRIEQMIDEFSLADWAKLEDIMVNEWIK